MDAFLRVIEVTLDSSCGGLITVRADIAARVNAPHLNTNEASKDEQGGALWFHPRGREVRRIVCTRVPSHIWNANQQAPMRMNATLPGHSLQICCFRTRKMCQV